MDGKKVSKQILLEWDATNKRFEIRCMWNCIEKKRYFTLQEIEERLQTVWGPIQEFYEYTVQIRYPIE